MGKISKEKISKIKKDFEGQLEKAGDLKSLESLRLEFLSRKSKLNNILKGLKDLSSEEKKQIGPLANKTRMEMEKALSGKKTELESIQSAEKEWIDVTLPGKSKQEVGHLNVLSQTQREIEDIFKRMGFEIADGPDIEDEWHNFDALNVPADHPARDMQDTFWLRQKVKLKTQNSKLKNKEETFKLLPRTQTSNVQIRYMETHEPPLKIIVPGRVFRNEATDANHEHTFYQFEALVVGKDISVANFKNIAKQFFTAFFGTEVSVRLRPSYFPFTEPSFEFDISCTVCGGGGCKSCKHSGWLEIGGAGMVNQRVFEACGYKRNQWQGFAWGFGIERLAMMKYKIDDIRLFMSGDLRFIRQF